MYYDDETVIRDRKSDIIYTQNLVLFVHPEFHMLMEGIVKDFTPKLLVEIEYQRGNDIQAVCVNPRNIVKI